MPQLKRNLVILFSFFTPRAKSKVRETVMAVNMLVRTPMPKTKAKPLITEVEANQNKITAVIMEERLESRMEVQARVKPS